MTVADYKEPDDILTCAPRLGPVSELPPLCDVIADADTNEEERRVALKAFCKRPSMSLP